MISIRCARFCFKSSTIEFKRYSAKMELYDGGLGDLHVTRLSKVTFHRYHVLLFQGFLNHSSIFLKPRTLTNPIPLSNKKLQPTKYAVWHALQKMKCYIIKYDPKSSCCFTFILKVFRFPLLHHNIILRISQLPSLLTSLLIKILKYKKYLPE